MIMAVSEMRTFDPRTLESVWKLTRESGRPFAVAESVWEVVRVRDAFELPGLSKFSSLLWDGLYWAWSDLGMGLFGWAGMLEKRGCFASCSVVFAGRGRTVWILLKKYGYGYVVFQSIFSSDF